jgi:hypothetical protein
VSAGDIILSPQAIVLAKQKHFNLYRTSEYFNVKLFVIQTAFFVNFLQNPSISYKSDEKVMYHHFVLYFNSISQNLTEN